MEKIYGIIENFTKFYKMKATLLTSFEIAMKANNKKQFLESLLDLRYAIVNMLSIVSDFQRLVAAPFNMQFQVEAIY